MIFTKPLDSFDNLVVNMVTPDSPVNPIFFDHFHDLIFHPGQMDLYPGAFHIFGEFVQHICTLEIE